MPRPVLRRVCVILAGALALAAPSGLDSEPSGVVTERRVPDGGIQPRVAVDGRGAIHLISFRGEAAHGDVFYVRSTDGGTSFSSAIRVNSIAGSAIATGTVRGPQIAVGGGGRVHVAWNGSRPTAPGSTPMFYARLDDRGVAFEPQRNVAGEGYNIDGGGTVAADAAGHVYVVWHANAPGEHDEGRRRLWIARSPDEGRTFQPPRPAWSEPTGACGCCGAGAFADSHQNVYILFRSAFDVVHRDMYLLRSRDTGERFTGAQVDRWTIGACVMSTQAFAEGPSGTYAAWEAEGQVHLARVDADGTVTRIAAAPGGNRSRKHPTLAIDRTGTVLMTWTEGTAWNSGGAAVWQAFTPAGMPIDRPGRVEDVPVWSFVAAYARPRGFTVIH